MCVEMMLNASNLAFVAFAQQNGNLYGQTIAFFVMVVAAAEVVVGLAIIVTIYRTRRSASVDEPSLLKYWGRRNELTQTFASVVASPSQIDATTSSPP